MTLTDDWSVFQTKTRSELVGVEIRVVVVCSQRAIGLSKACTGSWMQVDTVLPDFEDVAFCGRKIDFSIR